MYHMSVLVELMEETQKRLKALEEIEEEEEDEVESPPLARKREFCVVPMDSQKRMKQDWSDFFERAPLE